MIYSFIGFVIRYKNLIASWSNVTIY